MLNDSKIDYDFQSIIAQNKIINNIYFLRNFYLIFHITNHFLGHIFLGHHILHLEGGLSRNDGGDERKSNRYDRSDDRRDVGRRDNRRVDARDENRQSRRDERGDKPGTYNRPAPPTDDAHPPPPREPPPPQPTRGMTAPWGQQPSPK